ncbi:MAG TPA: translation initiation factor IF-3 [Firmicutes bacterium]|jgi:translation initiation factor IF-3|nr:translation initiation factor IF-3 [Bacillota bacterium]
MSVCAWGLSLVDAAGGECRPFFYFLIWRGDTISRESRVNNEIRAREVRVIDANGEQLGILSVRDALRLAGERQLDLVEVAPNAVPPVCRIMDYGKHKYEQSKREKVAKKKQRVITIKEVRMSPKIDEHDFDVKVRAAERFLKAGDKVKVSVRFRGREIVHADLAKAKLAQLADLLKEIGTVERLPKLEGRQMIAVLAPKTDGTKE